MGRFSLALLATLWLAAPAAYAETCTSDASATVTSITDAAAWGGCTPTADDDFVVASGFTVVIGGDWGASGTPHTGTMNVESGGRLDLTCGIDVFANNLWLYEDGSDGKWDCEPLGPFPLPNEIFYPTHDTIQVDFTDSGGPPAPLCDSSGVPACTNNDIHDEDGTAENATWLYVEWAKYGVPSDHVRLLGTDGRLAQQAVYSPGIFLEVTGIDTTAETLDLNMPQLGPDEGWRFFGAGNDFVMDGNALAGDGSRCNECVTDPGTGVDTTLFAEDDDDVSGERLRNAVNEGNFTVASVGLFENATTGGWRYEIRLNTGDAPFDTDREFAGALACKDGDLTVIPTESINFPDVCFRIWDTYVDGSGSSEVLVVAKDPRGILQAGDELNVYMLKLTPGDAVYAVNPIHFFGNRSAMLRVDRGSLLGNSTTSASSSPFRGVKFEQMGPNFDPGLSGANDTEDYAITGGGLTSSKFGVYFGNGETAGLRIDTVWTYHWGGQEDSTTDPGTGLEGNRWVRIGKSVCGPSEDQACSQAGAFTVSSKQSPNTTAGQTLTDVELSRIWLGFPNLRIATDSIVSGEPDIGYTGISPEVLAGVAPNNWRAAREPGDAVWSNFRMRKVRTEAFQGISSANGPIFRNCEDNLWLQHGLFVNNFTGHERATSIDNEVLEHSGSSATCNSDRWVVTAATHGSPVIMRCMGCLDGETTSGTSFIVSGANDTNPAIAVNTYSGNDDTGTQAHVEISNFLFRQYNGNQAAPVYGAHIGHYSIGQIDPINDAPNLTDGGGTMMGYAMCLDTVGMFAIGQASGNAILPVLLGSQTTGNGPDACSGNADLEVLDFVLLNYNDTGAFVNDNNIPEDRTDCGGTINTPGSDACSNPERVIYDGVLMEADSTQKLIVHLFDATELAPYELHVRNATLLTDESNSEWLVLSEGWEDQGKIAIGPNTHFYPPGATPCDNASAGGPTPDLWADKTLCIPNNDDAVGGDGSQWGASDLGLEAGASRRDAALVPGLVPSLVTDTTDDITSLAFCDTAADCDPSTALPQWSGPYAETWVNGYMTTNPVWGFRRTEPRWGRVPSHVKSNLNDLHPGGGGGGTNPRTY